MVLIQAQNITIAYLKERFGLQQVDSEQLFREWSDNLPEITAQEKQYLDRVKANYFSLVERRLISEEMVKMVVLAPLLDLASFYYPPFDVQTEKSLEIALEDDGEIIRGRIDVLVIQHQFWLLVIESKNAGFSLLTAIPQALAYLLGNPHPEKPAFGLVLNGSDLIFLKLIQQDIPQYAMSKQFTLLQPENELYKVLSILKKLGEAIS